MRAARPLSLALVGYGRMGREIEARFGPKALGKLMDEAKERYEQKPSSNGP